jgi:hypothetical protein
MKKLLLVSSLALVLALFSTMFTPSDSQAGVDLIESRQGVDLIE